jgi:hypothetical protein
MLIWSRRPLPSPTRTLDDLASLPFPCAREGRGGYWQAHTLRGPPASASGRRRTSLCRACLPPRGAQGRQRPSPTAVVVRSAQEGPSNVSLRRARPLTTRQTVHREPSLPQDNVLTSLAVALVSRLFISLRDALDLTSRCPCTRVAGTDRASAARRALFGEHGTQLPEVPGMMPC